MKWRGPMVDATAATVATVVTLAILAEGGLGGLDPRNRVLDSLGLLLALASGLPLAVARRWPAVVFAISAMATIVLMYLRYPLDVPLGPLYAGYVLVLAWGGAGSVRRGVAAAGVVAYVPIILVALGVSGVNVWTVTTELSTWGLAMVGVWLAAERTRLRQSELSAAEERATRTEREAERENRLAAAEERTRIARELHDSAGHAINVILVQAGAARLLHERDPAASLHAISTVEEVARATIVDIDRMVHALRSADGEPVPADPAALEELLDHHRRSGLRLATTFTGERRPLPRSVAWAAYRILQEALTNAARHGAGTAEVMVGFGTHAMEIAVSNPTSGGGEAGGANGGHADEGPGRHGDAVSNDAGSGRERTASRGAPASALIHAGHPVESGRVALANGVTPVHDGHAAEGSRAASGLTLPPADEAVDSNRGLSASRTNAVDSNRGSSASRTNAVDSNRSTPIGRAHAVGAGAFPLYRPNGGHGLIGMRERATLLGGTFTATIEAGAFRVRVLLPYDATRERP